MGSPPGWLLNILWGITKIMQIEADPSYFRGVVVLPYHNRFRRLANAVFTRDQVPVFARDQVPVFRHDQVPGARPVSRLLRLIPWLGMLFFLLLWTRASPVDPADMTGPPVHEAWWRERFLEKQAELHRQPVRLVFLGDSIFHSFEWDVHDAVWTRWYGGRGAVDLGFNGDGTADVIWRIRHGELDGVSPAMAVILIGTNDLGRPPAEVAAAIEALAQAVHDRSADTRILILGLLPSGRPAGEQGAVQDINARLSGQYARPGAIARFQDVSCVFLRRGRLNAALFREPAVPGRSYPLHPTLRGMDLLAAAIEPAVADALGDKPRTTSGELRGTDCAGGE
jgi:lysophospholipase L1-like esterase